ncbi:LOW QUALITY PROTEIN: epithelial sodium channel subunit delta [Megaptera novaeangliae]
MSDKAVIRTHAQHIRPSVGTPPPSQEALEVPESPEPPSSCPASSSGGGKRPAGAVAQAAGGGPGTRTCPQLPPSPPPPPPEEERGERLVELHASFRELVTFFCTNAAIHGTIRLVCSSQNRLKTVSWALLLAGALGLLCWQFGLLFERYWRYPAIVTVSIHSEGAQRRLFPSVTLCDMNPHRPHPARRPLRALDSFARENIYSLYGFNFSDSVDVPGGGPEPTLQLDQGIRLQRLSPLWGQNRVGCKLRNSTGGDCIQQAYSSGVAAAREWYRFHCANALALPPAAHEDSHHSCSRRFVFSCRYDDQDRQARRFQTPHHSSYSSCYTFDGVWAAQHPGLTHAECQPGPGVGGVSRPPPPGISLVLGPAQHNHLPLLSMEAGIEVTSHTRDHTPLLEHRGFSIRPGTETTVGIREGLQGRAAELRLTPSPQDEVHRLWSPCGHRTDSTGGVTCSYCTTPPAPGKERELGGRTGQWEGGGQAAGRQARERGGCPGPTAPVPAVPQACLVSCFQPLVVETRSCGCSFYPLPAGAQYCSSVRRLAWGHCFHRLCKDLETHRLPCASRCPWPCRDVTGSVSPRESSCNLSAGTSSWPSSKSAVSPGSGGRPGPRSPSPRWVQPPPAEVTSWPLPLPSSPSSTPREGPTSRSRALPLSPAPRRRSNLAKVNIFYQELSYRTVDEDTRLLREPPGLAAGVLQLLSATGSLWSLWFGSCVLSVVEVLELLLDAAALALLLCCHQLCGARGQPRAATGVPAPSQRPAGGRVAAGMTLNARGQLHPSRCCRGSGRGLGWRSARCGPRKLLTPEPACDWPDPGSRGSSGLSRLPRAGQSRPTGPPPPGQPSQTRGPRSSGTGARGRAGARR